MARTDGRGMWSRRSRRGLAAVAVVTLLAACQGAPGVEDVAAPGPPQSSSADGSTTSTEGGTETTEPDGTETTEPGGTETTEPGGTETTEPGGTETTEPGGTGGGTAGAPPGLEEFYGQDLEWSQCDDAECARLTVPLDYEDPTGQTIEIAVLRVPATGDRLGSLLINPGGPGASGVEYARTGLAVTGPVSERYDVVGFDPRGVAGSAPIDCIGDAELDEWFGFDPTPDDQAEQEQARALNEAFADGCAERAGDLLGHVSTVEAARDMDVLRAALGEDSLTYLGASYGTFLGATYAELFPDRVGRLVLDGAVDPTLSGIESSKGQAEGFERAATAYVEDCVAGGDCPLGADVESAKERLSAFLDELDAQPVPIEGDVVTELTEGWALYGIIVAMYDEAGWPLLTSALEDAFEGDGTMLMFLASLYVDRTSDGTYNSNLMEAFQAISCLDASTEPEDDRTTEELRAEFEEVSPTFGRFLAGEGTCEHWEAEAQTALSDYSASGAAPIVVVGTTRDPATPYEWAQALADQLESGVLVTYDGDGHTAYGRSNACVDDAIEAYLIEGTVPEDGLTC